MKPMKRFLGLLALCVVGVAHAHAHLLQAAPADGSTLTQPPSAFSLKFNEAATLTALTIQKDGQPAQKVGALPTKPSAQFNIPAPKLDAGSYTLTYRVLSDDNHVMSGTVKFKVTPAS
jgi:methionine-rich copper-binding protein CopC